MRKPCYDKEDANKGAQSKQEEKKLMDHVRIPQASELLRCSKSCRLRWINNLSSGIKPGSFTEDEDDLIVKLHALLGERWSLIAGRLPGRTAHEVKDYWNAHLSMKLIRMGIDPKNYISQKNVLNRRQSHKHNEKRHFSSPEGDNDRDSAAASSPEDDSFCTSSELNLDLTLSLHSSRRPTCQNEESIGSIRHGKEDATFQTLPLFR